MKRKECSFAWYKKLEMTKKVSDGPSRVHTAKRLIFPSGPFCQSRSHFILITSFSIWTMELLSKHM